MALFRADPNYLSNLQTLPLVERERLLLGNWKIRAAAGLFFRREWCTIIEPDEIPAGLFVCRYWDLAGTEKTETNDPDWTCGVKLGRDVDGFLYVLDVVMIRKDPYGVEQELRNVASHDTCRVPVGFGLDPGQAGKFQASYYVRQLVGYTVLPEPESGKKETRFGPFNSTLRVWREQHDVDEQRHIVMIEIGEKRTQFVDRPGSRERLAVGTGGERKAVGNPTAIRGKQGIELAIARGCGGEFMFKGHHPRKLVFA